MCQINFYVLSISLPWSIHISFGFLFELFKILWNTLTIVVPFLSFKGTAKAYLLNKSIAHKRYLVPLFYLLIKCISAKSTLQILSLKEEYTFLFLNFIIIGLWSSSANCWFSLILYLIPAPFDFLSKNL